MRDGREMVRGRECWSCKSIDLLARRFVGYILLIWSSNRVRVTKAYSIQHTACIDKPTTISIYN